MCIRLSIIVVFNKSQPMLDISGWNYNYDKI